MATESLPTKPERDAKCEPPSREGPRKEHHFGGGGPVRAGAPEKAPVDPRIQAQAETPLGKGGGPPPTCDLPDQERPRQPPMSGEQYLRLRVRVDDGRLSIVGSQLVDGPLAQADALVAPFAYEVTAADRLLHAGAIPDLGTFRSFAHPKGTTEQRRHHSYQLSQYEFVARIPAERLADIDLGEVAVALYRVEQPNLEEALTAASDRPFAARGYGGLREIGRVVGLPPSVLPPDLASRAQRQLSRGTDLKKQGNEDSRDDQGGGSSRSDPA